MHPFLHLIGIAEKLFTENLKHFLSNDYEKMINIEYKNIKKVRSSNSITKYAYEKIYL